MIPEEEKRVDEKIEEMKCLKDVVKNLQDDAYWEQVRIDAAIAAMHEMIRDVCPELADIKVITEISVQLADALVEELKKEK